MVIPTSIKELIKRIELCEAKNITMRNNSLTKSSTGCCAHTCLGVFGNVQADFIHDIDETNNCTIKTGIGTYPMKYYDGVFNTCPDNQTLILLLLLYKQFHP